MTLDEIKRLRALLEDRMPGWVVALQRHGPALLDLAEEGLCARERLCVMCGRTFDASKIAHQGQPDDCPSPDACTLDMTWEEAANYWSREYHKLRDSKTPPSHGEVEGDTLRARIAELEEALGWFVAREAPILAKFGLYGPEDTYAAMKDAFARARASLSKKDTP